MWKPATPDDKLIFQALQDYTTLRNADIQNKMISSKVPWGGWLPPKLKKGSCDKGQCSPSRLEGQGECIYQPRRMGSG